MVLFLSQIVDYLFDRNKYKGSESNALSIYNKYSGMRLWIKACSSSKCILSYRPQIMRISYLAFLFVFDSIMPDCVIPFLKSLVMRGFISVIPIITTMYNTEV